MAVHENKEKISISEWGKVFLNWTEEKQYSAMVRLWEEFDLNNFLDGKKDGQCEKISDDEYRSFVQDFNVRDHFVVTLNHKKFILKSFSRFQKFFESNNLQQEQIEKHDDSKLTNFLEIVGYTQRWIWNTKTDAWKDAWKHHYTTNPHHPEYYQCLLGSGEITQTDMNDLDIAESVIDMLACRWERKLNGKEDVEKRDLLDIEEFYLERYTDRDRVEVKNILKHLMESPNGTK